MGGLSNYREVGKFDVLEAPRNPIGAFDAEQFKKEALLLFDKGSNDIVVDLGNLDFLYSDAFNAFSMVHQKLSSRSGTLGILAADELAVKSLQQAGVDRYVKVFRVEPELMAATLQPAPVVHASVYEHPASSAPVETNEPHSDPPQKRTHKFTQSFNSTLMTDDTAEETDLKGLPGAFDAPIVEAKKGHGTLIGFIIGAFVIIGGVVSWILLK